MSNQTDEDFKIEVAEALGWEHTLYWLLANYWTNYSNETNKNLSSKDDFVVILSTHNCVTSYKTSIAKEC